MSGSEDKTIKVWDARSGECLKTLKLHTDQVKCVLNLKNGSFASASSDKSIKIWHDTNFSLIRTLSGHSEAVRSLSLTEDGFCFYS